MIGYLKVNQLKGCHTQTRQIDPLAKVALKPFAVDDPRCSARDASDCNTFHTEFLCRNTVLPFFLLQYAWQILT